MQACIGISKVHRVDACLVDVGQLPFRLNHPCSQGDQRFEIWGELFVVVLFLRRAQKQHNNTFSLFFQKASSNFELLQGDSPGRVLHPSWYNISVMPR